MLAELVGEGLLQAALLLLGLPTVTLLSQPLTWALASVPLPLPPPHPHLPPPAPHSQADAALTQPLTCWTAVPYIQVSRRPCFSAAAASLCNFPPVHSLQPIPTAPSPNT